MEHVEFGWQSADGLQFFAQSWKPAEDPYGVICLVHGLGEHSGRYEYLAEDFVRAGYAFAGFDMRGHGRSDGPRGHIPSYAVLIDDVSLFLNQLSIAFPGVPRFLYGHSLGGGVVLNLGLRSTADIAGIIATSPWLRTTTPPPGWKLALGRLLYRVSPGFGMPSGLESGGLSHDPDLVLAYDEDPLVHSRISAQLGMDAIDAGEWALDHADEFALPVLLVHGNADPITSCEATCQFGSQVSGDCTVKVWPGLYHETHNEPNRDEVVAFTLEWVRAHIPEPAKMMGDG